MVNRGGEDNRVELGGFFEGIKLPLLENPSIHIVIIHLIGYIATAGKSSPPVIRLVYSSPLSVIKRHQCCKRNISGMLEISAKSQEEGAEEGISSSNSRGCILERHATS